MMDIKNDSARQQEYLQHSVTVKTQMDWTHLRHESLIGDVIG